MYSIRLKQNGAAMPTDEDDQDGHFFFNHPERGGVLRCLGPRSHCYCSLDPTRGGRTIQTPQAFLRPASAIAALCRHVMLSADFHCRLFTDPQIPPLPLWRAIPGVGAYGYFGAHCWFPGRGHAHLRKRFRIFRTKSLIIMLFKSWTLRP